MEWSCCERTGGWKWSKRRLATNNIFTNVVVSLLTAKYPFLRLRWRHFISATDWYPSFTAGLLHGRFRKFWPFLKCGGHEKTHLAIFSAIFSIFIEDFVFFYFVDGLHVTVTVMVTAWYCCDRKFRAACAQSFAPWQQATKEIMRCSLSYYCLLVLHI